MRVRPDGDIAEVRALIDHPMETGLRKDPKTGEPILCISSRISSSA